ncbi:hypothetical protein EBAPG3_009310 [Nitrosospira lacus]|uniref:Uncharacterized protein n=1 Tax=Nitrosospira lacus TaxID=1288494 RepID=A0A1W6SQ72_9PROT|nr:hypothetical protein [Nitrosospira lacus]ARO87947.1 hypothetical protein EBAPG3_009310 [Nitrosospira lacus]
MKPALKGAPTPTATENETAMKDADRGLIALEATWRISALVTLMRSALDNDECTDDVVWATKEVLKGVAQLNNVIMTAIDDPNETNEDLRARVN